MWDRNDYDGDGNFDEPDGYIDHFQAVHAGMGEEVGGGAQGGAAIWSHRWFAYYNMAGLLGPAFNKAGGVRIGNSDYWVGDYTVEPENGGVGVFAHEFGHDLDLPDLYDTNGADNSTGFWTLMSSGSYGSDGKVDIGSKPVHMGAWEKLQLGWLKYEVAHAGKKSEHKLGPATYNTQAGAGTDHGAARQRHRTVCGQRLLLQRQRCVARHDDESHSHAADGFALAQRAGSVRHRG